jgi:hypothetical protein
MVGTGAVHFATLPAAPDVTGTAKHANLNAGSLIFFDNVGNLADKVEIQNIIDTGGQSLSGQFE